MLNVLPAQHDRPRLGIEALASCVWLLFLLCAVTAASAASGARSAGGAKLDKSGKPRTGEASYYGTHSAGDLTASGKPFDPGKMTAASPTLPMGTKAKVTNKETGQTANVTVNDRGPFVEDRILDVSPKVADKLGMKDDGVAQVKVEPLHVPKAPAEDAR